MLQVFNVHKLLLEWKTYLLSCFQSDRYKQLQSEVGHSYAVQPHPFIVFRYTHVCRVLVPARFFSQGIKVMGIYPGARVVRGNDWKWGDQDGKLCGVADTGFVV